MGICSMHPAAVPGTPQHGHYVIGGHTTNDLDLATSEQIHKCVDLARDCKKEVYIVPADVSSSVADMGSLVTAVTLSGVLTIIKWGPRSLKLPRRWLKNRSL